MIKASLLLIKQTKRIGKIDRLHIGNLQISWQNMVIPGGIRFGLEINSQACLFFYLTDVFTLVYTFLRGIQNDVY